MALFKGRDALRLPLLTQFVQLDGIDELKIWVERRFAAWSRVRIEEGAVWHINAGIEWRKEHGNERPPTMKIDEERHNPERWVEMEHLHKVIYDLMSAAADFTSPPQESLAEYSRMLVQARAFDSTLWVVTHGERYTIGSDDRLATWEELIYLPLLEEFDRALREHRIQRCQSCFFPFCIHKKAQMYCSWRCAHKINQRGRHQKP